MAEQESGFRPRLFTGFALSPEVRAYVAAVAARLSATVPGVRWVPPENLHVTLKFIGQCEDARVPRLVQAMRQASEALPIRLEIGGVGGFPSQSSARVIWVGADDGTGRVKKVYEVLDKGAEKCGFPREKRAYRPHITIGRARKKPVALPPGIDEEPGRLTLAVNEIVLFHSELKSTGAEYSVVERTGPGKVSDT